VVGGVLSFYGDSGVVPRQPLSGSSRNVPLIVVSQNQQTSLLTAPACPYTVVARDMVGLSSLPSVISVAYGITLCKYR